MTSSLSVHRAERQRLDGMLKTPCLGHSAAGPPSPGV